MQIVEARDWKDRRIYTIAMPTLNSTSFGVVPNMPKVSLSIPGRKRNSSCFSGEKMVTQYFFQNATRENRLGRVLKVEDIRLCLLPPAVVLLSGPRLIEMVALISAHVASRSSVFQICLTRCMRCTHCSNHVSKLLGEMRDGHTLVINTT